MSSGPNKRSPKPPGIQEDRGYRFIEGIGRGTMMEAIDAARREQMLDELHNGEKDFES